MVISYKKLWKLLIDKDMKKKDLQELAGISSASITKLGKNENINTDILQKVCTALECDISDIMEMVSDKQGLTCQIDDILTLHGHPKYKTSGLDNLTPIGISDGCVVI